MEEIKRRIRIQTETNHQASEPEAMPKRIPRGPPPLWMDLLFLLLKIALIALAAVLLFAFLFGIARCPDPSMTPAVKDGDIVIFYRYNPDGYQPRDTVVLELNGQKQIVNSGL